ncbi:hypothetical protein ACR6C2_21790 [Streptomyces sp. INA 01156]
MDQLAFLAGLGFLAAFELIEWPIALAIGVGHELARSRHGKVLREFGRSWKKRDTRFLNVPLTPSPGTGTNSSGSPTSLLERTTSTADPEDAESPPAS